MSTASDQVNRSDQLNHGFALTDGPRAGAENMALDQRMLEHASQHGCATLRLYRWNTPTLSLGYFQPYAERDSHVASNGLSVVRRSTGGGAIVHHHDWTYSLTASPNLLSDGQSLGASTQLYDAVHDSVVAWLIEHGLAARKWSDATCAAPASGCNFLCFERRSTGDVVLDSGNEHFKVMGSAQRRYKGSLLQHGSLLLRKSQFAPSLPGVQDFGDLDDSSQAFEAFFERLRTAVASALKTELPRRDTAYFDEEIGGLQNFSANDATEPSAREPRFAPYDDTNWTHKR